MSEWFTWVTFLLRFLMTIEEDVTGWQEMPSMCRRQGEMGTEGRDELWAIMSNCFYSHALMWDQTVSLLWWWPPTWLCMNFRLIPSSVTWSSPPSPVFMSWTGNSPPSSGPEEEIHSIFSPPSQMSSFPHFHLWTSKSTSDIFSV